MDSNGEPTESLDSPTSDNLLRMHSESRDTQTPCNNNNNTGSFNSQCPELLIVPQLTTLCMTQLMSSNPTVLLGYISFLQERVGFLVSDHKRLLDENLQLRRRINQIRNEAPSESDGTLSDTDETFASNQTFSNTSVNGLSVSQIQLGSPALVQASGAALLTGTSTSTPILSLYSRNGQEEAQALPSCSSHSIVTLRQATFLSSQNSANSLEEEALSQARTEQADRVNGSNESVPVEDSSDQAPNTCSSMPNIVTEALSGCTIVSDLCIDIDDEGFNHFVKHPRHSWPIMMNPEDLVMTDFTLHLSSYVTSDTEDSDSESNHSSQYTTNDEDEDENRFMSAADIASETPLAVLLLDPETLALIEELDLSEDEEAVVATSDSRNSTYVDANEFFNVDLTSNPSQPVGVIPEHPPRVNGIIEHPFQTRLQSSNYEFRELVLFRNPEYLNSQVGPDSRLTPGLQVGPRQAITMSFTLHGVNREESFMSRLRSQLYYNINVFTTELDMISPVDEAGSDNSLAFVTDNSNSSVGSIPQFEGQEPDDDQIAENLGLDYDILIEDGNLEGIEDLVAEDAGDSDSQTSSSNSDTGQGDAEADIMLISSSSSSATSLPHPPVERRRVAPTWMLPSSTNIEPGRYDFLRVTDRPRPYHGHRFVISVFGTKARKENEARLPSWVPTYAERLECILNQFIQQKNCRSNGGVMRSGASRKYSGRGSIFEISEAMGTSSQFYCKIRRNTSSIKKLKSCLKMNREGNIGESVTKVISWSEKLCHVDDRPRSPLEDSNSNAVPELDTTVTQTKSCPEMFCSLSKTTTRTQRKPVLCPKRIPICPLDTEPASSRKKKRAFGAILKRVCNCRRCTCVTTLSSTSSTCCSHGLEPNT